MNRKPLSFPAASPAGNLPAGVVPAGVLPAAAFEYAPQTAPSQQQAAQQQQLPAQQPAMQAPPAMTGMQNMQSGATDAQSIKRELNELMRNNLLPPGFDLVAAAQDPAFVRLTQEMPAYAAVRVYHAEQRAQNAERQAMQNVMQRLLARESLPRAARADTAAIASRDYLSMSPEEFARVEREFRDKARRGIKVKL